MTKVRTWINNGILIAVSCLVPVLLVEVFLMVRGDYADQVSADLQPSNTVWGRTPNTIDEMAHPDLQYSIPAQFDRFGIRNHDDVDDYKQNYRVGFFGDSFTANLRVDDRFSLSSLINEFTGQRLVANFGEDGFGVEQAYQRWLNLRGEFALEHVVYIFCMNDLRNLYEVQLFDEEGLANGELLNRYSNRGFSVRDTVVRFLGKRRVTYLALEGYYKAKQTVLSGESMASRLVNQMGEGNVEYQSRFQDEFASELFRDATSADPSPETLEQIEKFRQILQLWRDDVRAYGGEFHVAFLPNDTARALGPVLVDEDTFNIIHLPTASEVHALSKYRTTFVNDGHWNEVGNLASVEMVVNYFQAYVPAETKSDMRQFVAEQLRAIVALYASHGATVPLEENTVPLDEN